MSTETRTVKDLVIRNAAERGDSPFIEFYDEAWHFGIHAERSFATQKVMLLAEAPSKHYKSKAREIVGLDG